MYMSRGRALALLVLAVAVLLYGRFAIGPDPASAIESVDVRLAAPCRLSDDGRVVDARVAVTSRTTEATQVVLRLAVAQEDSSEDLWQDVVLAGGDHEQTVRIHGRLDAARPQATCTVGVDY